MINYLLNNKILNLKRHILNENLPNQLTSLMDCSVIKRNSNKKFYFLKNIFRAINIVKFNQKH